MKTYSLSKTGIDRYVWDVEAYIAERLSVDQAERLTSPLRWYIGTGRASTAFIRGMITLRPFVIARVLLKGGADEEVVNALKKRVKCD